MKFRKKPVVIEAVRWTGDNLTAIAGAFPDMSYTHLGGVFKVIALAGEHIASVGDWIVRDAAGECYPCKSDIFEATYEPARPVIVAGDHAIAPATVEIVGDPHLAGRLPAGPSGPQEPPTDLEHRLRSYVEPGDDSEDRADIRALMVEAADVLAAVRAAADAGAACKVELGLMAPDPRSGGCDQPACTRCYPERGRRAEADARERDLAAAKESLAALRRDLLAALPVAEAAIALACNEFLGADGPVDLKGQVFAAVRTFGLGDAACAHGRAMELREMAKGGGDHVDGISDDGPEPIPAIVEARELLAYRERMEGAVELALDGCYQALDGGFVVISNRELARLGRRAGYRADQKYANLDPAPPTWTPSVGASVRRVKPLVSHVGEGAISEVGEVIEHREGRLPWVVRWPSNGVVAYAAAELRPADDLTPEESIADIDQVLAADGWERIGAACSVGRRSVWMRLTLTPEQVARREAAGFDASAPLFDTPENVERIELRWGREGDDGAMSIGCDEPRFAEWLDLLCAFRWAVQS